MKSCSCHANWCYESVWRCAVRVTFLTRGVAAGFGHHCMPPPGCNNIAAILLMSWATLLPILIILRLFVLELWAGRVRHTMWPCDLDLLFVKFEVRGPYSSGDIAHYVPQYKKPLHTYTQAWKQASGDPSGVCWYYRGITLLYKFWTPCYIMVL